MKKFQRISLLALLLALCLVLGSCSGLFSPEDTTSPITLAPSTGEGPLSDAELSALLGLVNLDKVSAVQSCYSLYYVGEYRSVADCDAEIRETIRSLDGVRTVVDTEGATRLYIDLYARMQGDYYGYYYSPDDFSDYGDDINGEYTGIGVSVTLTEDGYAEILNVFPSSPAEEAGILPGDRIVAVEGQDFAAIGYQNAVDAIRGIEGTSVTVTVERAGQRQDFSVVRRRVTEVTVEHRMLEGKIGYIRIVSFNQSTYEQFVSAHRELRAAGAEAYVFDVRYNPGGTLDSVVAILEYVLPSGPIVHLNYKSQRQTIESIYDVSPGYMADKTYYRDHEIDEPMVVLSNGGTASAGELFTSSLKDYGVASVIGEQTYGKGVGQSSIELGRDGSALVMTTFFYDPPTSQNYNGVGITPDHTVPLSEEAAGKNLYKLTYAEDAQLQAAVSALSPAGVK